MKNSLLCIALVLLPITQALSAKPSSEQAARFVTDAEKQLAKMSLKLNRAQWVQSTFITDDTQALAADANGELIEKTTQLITRSRQFDQIKKPYDVERKLELLKLSLVMPASSNSAERDELTKLAASLEGAYGKGKYCADSNKGKCLSLGELEEIMASSRNPEELKKVWL